MPHGKFTKSDCEDMLREKYRQLSAKRYPRRSDFSQEEAAAIKAFLGPWPRALETAGVKPPRADDRKQRNLEKRIKAKRKINESRKEKGENEE